MGSRENFTFNFTTLLKSFYSVSQLFSQGRRIGDPNAIPGIVEDESLETDDIKLINHILLTFKQSLYNCRDAPTPPNFFYVRERLKQIQETE